MRGSDFCTDGGNDQYRGGGAGFGPEIRVEEKNIRGNSGNQGEENNLARNVDLESFQRNSALRYRLHGRFPLLFSEATTEGLENESSGAG